MADQVVEEPTFNQLIMADQVVEEPTFNQLIMADQVVEEASGEVMDWLRVLLSHLICAHF